MELWKDIAGYEGYYQVSNLGRVRSLDRTIERKGPKKINGKIITPTDNGNGYLIVGLRKEGVRKNHYVHRLVAAHFLSEWNNEKVVDHIDYCRQNNSVENLRVVTQLENIGHSADHMKKPRASKKHGKDKYIYHRAGKFRVCLPKMKERYFDRIEDAREYKKEALNAGKS